MSSKLFKSAAFAVTGLSLLSTPGCRLDDLGGAGGAADPGCGPGHCEKDRYCEGGGCFEPTATISVLMCQCNLIDPACGNGTCVDGAYATGTHCAAPGVFPATSTVSEAMCGGATVSPKSCCTHGGDTGSGAGAGAGGSGAGGSGAGGSGAGAGAGGSGAGSGVGGSGAGGAGGSGGSIEPGPCAPTWGPGTFHDTYFRDSTGTDFTYPVTGSPVLPGYQVCDYDSAVTPAECNALWGLPSTEPMLLNSYCQQFTDASDGTLNSISFAPDPLAPVACPPTWGAGVYHDTYFRDSTGTDFTYPVTGSPVLPGYQACDYTGTVTHAGCSALLGVDSSQPILQNSYCQEFLDTSDAVLLSVSFAPDPLAPGPCPPTWGVGVYHDTYFRDSTGTDFTYPVTGSPVLPGYQVCDYTGAVTHAGCNALLGVDSSQPILQNSYCQEFTDASDGTLLSISFAPDPLAGGPCPPTWGAGVYHDTYFRDSTGTDFTYPVTGSPVLPGYQVCDYSGTVTHAGCNALLGVDSSQPILQNSYCQEFTDASDTTLLSVSFTPDPLAPHICKPTWGVGVYHDTYFRDSTGTDFLYPVTGSPVLPGYQVCDYSGTVTHAGCSALYGVSSTQPILQNTYCQQFTDASDAVLDSISFGP